MEIVTGEVSNHFKGQVQGAGYLLRVFYFQISHLVYLVIKEKY